VDIGAYYDRFWGGVDPVGLAAHDYRDFQVDMFGYVDRLIGPLDGQQVLEIGPGLGFETVQLARKGAQVWAIDLSLVSLDLVRARCDAAGILERTHLLQMNAEVLAFPDGVFNLVYVQNALVHTNWLQVVQECARALRPGGRAVFIEPLRHHPAVALYRATLSHCRDSQPRYLSWWDVQTIRQYFRGGQAQTFYFFAPAALAVHKTAIGRFLRRFGQAADRTLLRLPFLRPFGWYVVACFER
jgi:SAM-dependent methyltransferase